MTTNQDKKLQQLLKAWRKSCPENVMDVSDLRSALAESSKLKRELSGARQELKAHKKGTPPFEDFDDRELSALLTDVDDYITDLEGEQEEFRKLKTWLSRAKAATDEFPFSFVVRGNDQGSLYVNKRDTITARAGRKGKSELTGAKIHTGTCTFNSGRLVFTFDNGARAPWRPLLQKIVSKAGVSFRVSLAGLADDDDT